MGSHPNWLFGKDGALLRASANGYADLAEELLKAGARPDVKSANGVTPLHRAAQNGHRKTVELLLKNDAPAACRTVDGATPADMAESNGHNSIALFLRGYESPE